jgi:hypothetical protein
MVHTEGTMAKQKGEDAAQRLREKCAQYQSDLVESSLRLSRFARNFVETFDPKDHACVVFAGSNPCANSAVASHWLRKGGAARPPRATDAQCKGYPHQSCIRYTEADMMAGNPGERALFVDHLASVFQMPHVSQGKHILLLHNVEYLSVKSTDLLLHSAHCCLILTTSRVDSISEKVRTRAQFVRVVDDGRQHPGLTRLVDAVLAGKGGVEEFRKFAHEAIKVCYPVGHVFRMLLARTVNPDAELVADICRLEHLATQGPVCPHALEAAGMRVLAFTKAAKKRA